MQEVAYPASVFHAILDELGKGAFPHSQLARQEFEVSDDGVTFKPFRPRRSWRPLDEILERGSPDPDTTRLLPIPFTARELAAFMVDGSGKHLVCMEFGDWLTAPEDWRRSCSRLPAKAQEAMLDACAAFREAADLADDLLPEDVRQIATLHVHVQRALEELELQEGVDPDGAECSHLRVLAYELEVRASNAYAIRSQGRREWQKAIVRRLLSAPSEASPVVSCAVALSIGQPRVRWRVGLAQLLPQFDAERKCTVTTVIRGLRKRGGPWGIHEVAPTNLPDGLQWTDEQGTVHDVTKKTVSTAISETRKEAKLKSSPSTNLP